MRYKIKLYNGNIYAVYDNEGDGFFYVFKGTIEEINAWVSLKEKEYI